MALDLSKYIGKRLPLGKEKVSLEELVEYLTTEGCEITKITGNSTKYVYVNDEYHITTRGLVRKVGRNKEKLSAWRKERKEQQISRTVRMDRELVDKFSKATNNAPFATWVKRKINEEIYGSWKSKLTLPQKYELVDDMVIVDDGETISFCHISEFQTKDFKRWTRIPPRSIIDNGEQEKKKRSRSKKEGR